MKVTTRIEPPARDGGGTLTAAIPLVNSTGKLFIILTASALAILLALKPSSANASAFTDEIEGKLNAILQAQPGKSDLMIELGTNHDPSAGVNSYVLRTSDSKHFKVMMTSALLNFPKISADTVAAILCHEVGHLGGGAPFYENPEFFGYSAEGQADDFMARTCLYQLWKSEASQNSKGAKRVDRYAKFKCDGALDTKVERELCYRIVSAGQSMVNLFDKAIDHGATPKLVDWRFGPVRQTLTDSYPMPLCRLQTFVSAAARRTRPNCWFID